MPGFLRLQIFHDTANVKAEPRRVRFAGLPDVVDDFISVIPSHRAFINNEPKYHPSQCGKSLGSKGINSNDRIRDFLTAFQKRFCLDSKLLRNGTRQSIDLLDEL